MSVAVLARCRFGYNQNGDKSKTAKIQLIQNAVLTCIENGENKLRVAVLDLSPFWRVAVLDTTKTATNPKRRHVKTATNSRRHFGEKSSWICRRFGFVAVLGVSPFWRVAVLDVSRFWLSPFWKCRRFGCRRFGSVAVLGVAVLDCRRFDRYPNKLPNSSRTMFKWYDATRTYSIERHTVIMLGPHTIHFMETNCRIPYMEAPSPVGTYTL